MARISKELNEIKSALSKLEEKIDVTKTPKKTLRKLIIHLKKIDDSRIQGKILYRMDEIIIMTFLAVLAFCDTWQDITAFCNENLKFFRKFLKLTNGIPSHDTFQRVFGLIDSNNFNKIIIAFFIESLDSLKKVLGLKLKDDEFKHLAVDGKELKGSGRLYKGSKTIRNLQILNVYDNSNEVCIYSKAIDKKTNEIPVAREILNELNLKRTIVTFDALHTQRETIKTIASNRGDYIGGLKGNQNDFLTDVVDYFTDDLVSKIKNTNNYYETIEKSHSQSETRKYYLTTDVKWFYNIKEWDKLSSFIMYEKTIKKNDVESKEIRYYISSLKDIKLCAEAIRGHWSVENNLHWQLDYAFKEDEQTTIDKNALTNLSTLKKLALALINLNRDQYKGDSVRTIRKKIGWNTVKHLNILLSRIDKDIIKNLLE